MAGRSLTRPFLLQLVLSIVLLKGVYKRFRAITNKYEKSSNCVLCCLFKTFRNMDVSLAAPQNARQCLAALFETEIWCKYLFCAFGSRRSLSAFCKAFAQQQKMTVLGTGVTLRSAFLISYRLISF